MLFVTASLTAAGGLTYISLRGTIGGPLMSIGFALYGVCVLVACTQTVRLARSRQFDRHRDWALRFFILAIGSWIYRLHYELWYAATGGLGMQADYRGDFDQIQVFAFFVPYLVGLEIYIRLRRKPNRVGTA